MITLPDFVVATYCLVGLGLMAQGLRYLIAGQFMHYHADVIKERWSQLGPPEQRLLLGLLKGFGAGMFCLGVAFGFVALVPLRASLALGAPTAAPYFLALVSIMYTAMLVHVTRFALLPGAAPIAVTITMCVLCVAAAAASAAAYL